MNKQEADSILLACKKHNISLTMRKEGAVYLVSFNNRIEVKSFDAAKHITNGLVVEGKFRKEIKEQMSNRISEKKLNFSKYPTKKNRPNYGSSFAERHGSN